MAVTYYVGPVPWAFAENFARPSSVRGRGGDLDQAVWGSAQYAPNTTGGPGVNYTIKATIPYCRSGFGPGDVWPPDNTLICDGASSNPGTLMTGAVIQYYGNNCYMIRQPFDFLNRTGLIVCDVDAWSDGITGTWVNVDITDDPVPAPTWLEASNHETGGIPKNAVMIQWSDNSGSPNNRVTIGNVNVYANYVLTTLTPTFSVSWASCPTTLQNSLNHIEIQLSATHLTVFMSDYSTDGGLTFPNFRKIYEADLTTPFSRGYVHISARNHATLKFGFSPTGVYHWDNVKFDGPVLAAPRAYEMPDNTTIVTGYNNGTDPPFDYMNLGYEISDGTNKAQGVWSPGSLVSPLTFTGSVNLSGMSSAKMTMNLFLNVGYGSAFTADTTVGLLYRLNGGTWRTRLLTSAEVTMINNTVGCAGNFLMVIDVPFGDLASGTNTIDFSTVNVNMGYPPQVANLDLLVAA